MGGFLVNWASLPPWIGWLRWLVPLAYAFEALIANEVSGLVFSLGISGLPEVSNLKPETVMRAIGLRPDRAQEDIGALVAFWAGFSALAFAAYAYNTHGLPRIWRRGCKEA